MTEPIYLIESPIKPKLFISPSTDEKLYLRDFPSDIKHVEFCSFVCWFAVIQNRLRHLGAQYSP